MRRFSEPTQQSNIFKESSIPKLSAEQSSPGPSLESLPGACKISSTTHLKHIQEAFSFCFDYLIWQLPRLEDLKNSPPINKETLVELQCFSCTLKQDCTLSIWLSLYWENSESSGKCWHSCSYKDIVIQRWYEWWEQKKEGIQKNIEGIQFIFSGKYEKINQLKVGFAVARGSLHLKEAKTKVSRTPLRYSAWWQTMNKRAQLPSVREVVCTLW